MAYETAVATSVADLLDKIRVFAQANGWTIDFNGTRTDGGSGNVVVMHKGSACATFYTDTSSGASDDPGPFIGCYTFPGPYSGAANPMSQANKTVGTLCNKMAGPFQAYHLFASADYLHVVVEITTGLFRHMGVGVIEKAGDVTTGVYNYGTRWNYSTSYIGSYSASVHGIPWEAGIGNSWRGTEIRVDSEGSSPRSIWVNDTYAANPNGGWSGATAGSDHVGGPIKGLIDVGPSSITGRAILAPIMVGIDRAGGYVSLVGAPLDIRAIRIDNLNPGDTVTIGPDTWRVFPVVRKNGAAGLENTINYGLAYRVVS